MKKIAVKISDNVNKKMTQKQVKNLFGVTHNTFHMWSNPDNPKHNLYLLVDDMTYEQGVEKINDIKAKRKRMK